MYEFITEGMSCGNCAAHVTRAIQAEDPKAQIQVDLAQQKITVTSAQDPKILAHAVEEAGYPILKSVVLG